MSQFWLKKRVFITGCSGFIGSWLSIRLLELGAKVIGLIKSDHPSPNLMVENSALYKEKHSSSWLFSSGYAKKMKLYQGRVEDLALIRQILKENQIEIVFHLAAQTIVGRALTNPIETFKSNIEGTWSVLEACRQVGVGGLIVASTDKAYGEKAELPYYETDPLAATHPYDTSKACADFLAQSYYRTYQLPLAITRCGNVYGGGDPHFTRLIPGTIKSLLSGENPVIRSDGKFTRDFVYIDDIIQAYLLLAENLHKTGILGEAFNLSSGNRVEVLEVVNLIEKELAKAGRKPLEPLIKNEVSQEIRHQSLSSQKAFEHLGWKASTPLDQGLSRTVNWYLTHPQFSFTP